MGRAKEVNYCERIYGERWDQSELDQVGRVWRVLTTDFFQKFIPENAAVLDIGCGFCHFLNNVRAAEKVGVDANPLAGSHAAKDVKVIQSDDLSLATLANSHFDTVMISNFLEHLESSKEVVSLMERARELLKPRGCLIILQPNFRLVGSAYFDFIDHKTVLTDRSLAEALQIAGFKIERQITRFLPYTSKSRLPKSAFLVRLYLKIPVLWLVMGKQSMFVAVKQR